MDHPKTFHAELLKELDSFLIKQEKKYPPNETLTIDLHCHDHNSNTPDELLGRILNISETWLPSGDLIDILKNHGCDTFTVTNHNNARSCHELREAGIDVLTGAEFTCQVPDYQVGIHVLAYGFTPNQEKMLDKLRPDIYRFQEYAVENDIPTIWAHPLYHYHRGEIPPLDFFDKMALVFERFEVINGQRDTWQNMLVKIFVENLSREKIDAISNKVKRYLSRSTSPKRQNAFIFTTGASGRSFFRPTVSLTPISRRLTSLCRHMRRPWWRSSGRCVQNDCSGRSFHSVMVS